MNYFQQNQWYKWMFIGLVVLNICTLGIIWKQNGNPISLFQDAKPVHQDRKRQADLYLLNQLGYNEDQQSTFFNLSQQHAQEIHQLHADIRTAKQALFKALEEKQVDSSRVYALSNQVAAWHAKMEQATFYHFKAIRDLGTPEQQAKFDQVILSAVNMIGAPPKEK